jgi:ABC-2 type transport system ATP-binding protein
MGMNDAPSPFALEAVGLIKRFGSVTAVDHLTLRVKPQEIFGLIGPDGAGKTSTIRMLCGIMDPDGGEARVLGYAMPGEAESLKPHISYMPQRFGLYGDLTVAENIQFYADLYSIPRKERNERIPRLLQFSNLAPFQERLAQDLSGGMKQKLGLCCALIHTPRLLFLDEPTNGVDPVSRRDFWQILTNFLKEGVTIFVSTSYLDEAERCHRVALMHEGQMLVCDTPAALKGRMRERILALRCKERWRAQELLKGFPTVKRILLTGDALHLVVEKVEEAKQEIVHLLDQAGMEGFHLREISPSLEDIFVSTIQERRETQRLTHDPGE